MPPKSLIVIIGPTAIGKTSLAIRLAQYYRTEIISADSRQFYRELSIGTAKPTPEELAQTQHHSIGFLSIHDHFTVADFEKKAMAVLDDIFKVHDIAILVGGSGLFINSILNGLDELPKVSSEIRFRLNQLYSEKGIKALQEKLKEVDPSYFEEVDKKNPQRLIRALEVYEASGIPFSSFRKKQPVSRPFEIIKIGLNTRREILYTRINERVDEMVKDGLIEEVKSLISYKSWNALNTVGYSELFSYFEGEISLPEAIAQIKQNTRRFAKRQLTWFRKDLGVQWFEPDQYIDILAYVNQLLT